MASIAASSSSRRHEVISSAASAPWARASINCEGITRKSLRSTGMSTPARTASRSVSEPWKCVGSVRTEIAAAPPSR